MQIAEQWFHRKRVDDDITLIFEPHVHPLIRCNVWHLRGRDRDLLVDTALAAAPAPIKPAQSFVIRRERRSRLAAWPAGMLGYAGTKSGARRRCRSPNNGFIASGSTTTSR